MLQYYEIIIFDWIDIGFWIFILIRMMKIAIIFCYQPHRHLRLVTQIKRRNEIINFTLIR